MPTLELLAYTEWLRVQKAKWKSACKQYYLVDLPMCKDALNEARQVARRLLRERDEAIRSRNMAQDERTAAMTEYLHIIRERDDLQKEGQRWHDRYQMLFNDYMAIKDQLAGARQERDALAAENKRLTEQTDILAEVMNGKLGKENARLRKALEQVEWVKDCEGGRTCPWCEFDEYEGHNAHACKRQVALGLAKDGEWGLVYALLSDEVKSDAPCADDPTLL